MKNSKWIESEKFVRKSLKEEKATDSLFSDVVFSMIKKFKLKKEYDVERPSWYVFNFRHKNKDAQFGITFDKYNNDSLYGDVLAFGDEKDDIFKYKTDEVKVDSYNIEKECLNIIADCLAFIDTNKKITIFESKKSARKSLKESKSISDICNSWVIGDAVGKFKNRDYCHKGNDYSVFNIGNIIEDALRDNYILEFDGDNKAKSVIFYMVDKDGKNVGSLEIYPDERYEISNYEDGYDLSKLDMDEIADLFYEFQNNKIEYLLSDKRFDFTDKFWYNESKKFTRKSLKEGINDELIATSSDGETTLYLSDERQANHGKDPHYEFKLGENGYFTRYIRCDDNRCENVVLDWIKEFELDISKSEISKIIKLHESKKSVGKSIKESKDSDFFNEIAKDYHFSKDEKTRYKDKTHISAIGVLFDRINNAIKTYGRNSDEEYNALNDCWEVITSAKQNGFNVDYDEDRWNKIAGLPNYH